MATKKCPGCGFPLELQMKTSEAEFYRCTTCGKQTRVEKPSESENSADLPEKAAISPE